jgi:hypothetical protein
MTDPSSVSELVRIAQKALEANLEAPDYLIHESDIQAMIEVIAPRLKAEGLREAAQELAQAGLATHWQKIILAAADALSPETKVGAP